MKMFLYLGTNRICQLDPCHVICHQSEFRVDQGEHARQPFILEDLINILRRLLYQPNTWVASPLSTQVLSYNHTSHGSDLTIWLKSLSCHFGNAMLVLFI